MGTNTDPSRAARVCRWIWARANSGVTYLAVALVGLLGVFVGLFFGALSLEQLWLRVTACSLDALVCGAVLLWLAEKGKPDTPS